MTPEERQAYRRKLEAYQALPEAERAELQARLQRYGALPPERRQEIMERNKTLHVGIPD